MTEDREFLIRLASAARRLLDAHPNRPDHLERMLAWREFETATINTEQFIEGTPYKVPQVHRGAPKKP